MPRFPRDRFSGDANGFLDANLANAIFAGVTIELANFKGATLDGTTFTTATCVPANRSQNVRASLATIRTTG